jgi:WD40 repeat protein
VAFLPDGTTLLTGGSTIQLWDPATGRERLSLDAHQESVGAVKLSADGTEVLSASADRTIRCWETATGRPLRRVPMAVTGRPFTFTPSGKTLIAAGSDGSLRLLNVASGKEVRQIKGHWGPIDRLAVSADGTLLASAGGMVQVADKPTEDHAIHVWNLAAGKELLQIAGHHGPVLGLLFSPDGKTLASASQDQTLRLWDLATGTEIRRLGEAQYVSGMAFSPDGKILATGAQHQAILWDTATGKELARLSESPSWNVTLAFSPDGRILALGYRDGTLQLWELFSRQEIARFNGPPGGISPQGFSADGRLLITTDSENKLLV